MFLLLLPFFSLNKNNNSNDVSDLIVLLGGGKKEYRLKKALTYYKKNMPKSKEILYTGGDFTYLKTSPSNSRKFYFKNNNIPLSKIIYIPNTNNTMKELLFIKDYMLKKNYRNVSFISDNYHSFRIKILAKYFAHFENDFKIKVIDSGYSSDHFFNSLLLNFLDNIKLYYNIIKYSYLL